MLSYRISASYVSHTQNVCRDLFVALDTDSSGGIDAGELAAGLERRGYRLTRHEVRGTDSFPRLAWTLCTAFRVL